MWLSVARAWVVVLWVCGTLAASVAAAQSRTEVYHAALPWTNDRDSARAQLILPPGTARIRGVVVLLPVGDLAEYAFDSRHWRAMCARQHCALLQLDLPLDQAGRRDAARGGGQVLIDLVTALARHAGRPDLAEAGFVLWGHSGAAQFAATFAAWRPRRTIGIILYHGAGLGVVARGTSLPLPLDSLVPVPALVLHNTEGTEPGVAIAAGRALVRAMRARGAAWAFLEHPGPHNSTDGLYDASPLLLSWIGGVLSTHDSAQRVRPARTSLASAGWLLSDSTGRTRRASTATVGLAGEGWYPDEPSVLSAIRMRALCASLGSEAATLALGAGSRATHDHGYACQFASADSTERLILLFGALTHIRATPYFLAPDSGAAASFDARASERGLAARTLLGDRSFVGAERDAYALAPGITIARGCAVLVVRRAAATYDSWLCSEKREMTDAHRILVEVLRAAMPVQ